MHTHRFRSSAEWPPATNVSARIPRKLEGMKLFARVSRHDERFVGRRWSRRENIFVFHRSSSETLGRDPGAKKKKETIKKREEIRKVANKSSPSGSKRRLSNLSTTFHVN